MKKFIIILLFLYGILYGITIEIKQDGTGDYTTIQAGIDAAQDGDVVLVYPGTYYENLTISGKNITLASLEYTTGDESYIEQTVINGNETNSCVKMINEPCNILFEGITFTNGIGTMTYYGRYGGAFLIYENHNLMIQNCRIYNNYAENGGGIYISNSNIFLSGTDIFNNNANIGGALFLIYTNNTNITFDSMHRCNIYNNNAGSDRDLFASANSQTINVIVDTFTVMNPNSYFACHFNENAHFNFDILHSYIEPIDSDLYVATTGDDNNSGLTEDEPLQTINKAMQLIASNPDNPHTIHVASGTYSQTLNNQFFPIGIKSYVTLQGDDEDRPILLNEGIPETENYFFLNMIQDSYCIENIILHQGFDNIQDILFDFKSNNIVLKNITIENFIVNREYAICPFDGNNVHLINVNFNNVTNLAEPTPYLMNCNLEMKDCSFDNNRCTSFGTDSSGSPGLSITAPDSVIVENCKFINNQSTADYNYLISLSASQFRNPKIVMKNVLCANNQTSRGFLFILSAYQCENIQEEQLVNCTFVNNISYPYGSSLLGNSRLTNCIFYNPSTLNEIRLPNSLFYDHYNILTVDHCLIKEGENGIFNEDNVNPVYWLEGNIAGDPQFVGEGDYPFALSSTSPCIDAGTTDLPEGVTLPETDLAGNPRIMCDNIDIGAYEYQECGYTEPEELPPVRFTYITVYPNPFRIGGSKRNRMIFKVTLAEAGNVKANIYNLKGEKVAEITDAYLSPGVYRSKWDGKNDNGKYVAAGVYLFKLEQEGKRAKVKRFTVTK